MNTQVDPDDLPDWLTEVLHVVWALARREHEGPLRTLTAEHAQMALDDVPADIKSAAGIRNAV